MNLETRINQLRQQLQELNASHDLMVAQNQQANQEFNQQAQRNQNRFQQLVGAISELEKLQQDAANNNGDEPVPKNRLAIQ